MTCAELIKMLITKLEKFECKHSKLLRHSADTASIQHIANLTVFKNNTSYLKVIFIVIWHARASVTIQVQSYKH